MSTKTEGFHAGEFLVSEADGSRSRDSITVISGQTLNAGAVLGQITVGSITAGASTGTGNGTVSALSVNAGAIPGTYKATCTAAATNSGTFQVTDPNGIQIGLATVGVAFSSDHINFTINDGSTDWGVGAVIPIVVAAGSGKYTAVAPAAVDGSQVAVAILFDYTDASGGDKVAVAITRAAEVNQSELDYNTLNAGQITAANQQLAANGIIVRGAI